MPKIEFPKVLLLLVLIIVLGAGSSFAEVADNVLFKVRKVNFAGVNEINKKAFAESLVAKTPPVWKFWSAHPVIYMKDIKDDTLRIKQYYQTQGYYQTTVEYLVVPSHEEDEENDSFHQTNADKSSKPFPDNGNGSEDALIPECDITFQIIEGPPVIIRNILIDCLCKSASISETRISNTLLLKSGRIFKTDAYDQSKALIRKFLGNQGHPFASVSGHATVDLNDNSADIAFDIDPGQLYYFGDITITGHEGYVHEEVVHRAISIKSGQQFAAQALDESRRNLFDLNIFKTAVIKVGDPEAEINTVPIVIQVKPQKKQSVKFGVGYGTDDGARLQAGWNYRNLSGRADRLTLRARRSDIVENIYAEYFLPYFLSARNNLVATAGFEREETDYYTLQRTSSEVNFYRKLENHWFFYLGYNLAVNRPEDIHVDDSEDLIDPRDTENYLVSSVKFNIERNTVDDVLNSRKGSSVSFSIENAAGYLGSEIDYIRPGTEARVFIPLPWDMVLAGRMVFQTIQKTGDTDYIPISKQFFLGGSKSVRGYGFEKLGVIDHNDVIQDISGLSSFVSNMEVRFPVVNDFSGVLFLDAGTLDSESYHVNFKNLRYASGLGLRYNTIIGPIQIDFGYQLNPAKSTASDDPLLTDLLNKDRWYLHFNIGQTF